MELMLAAEQMAAAMNAAATAQYFATMNQGVPIPIAVSSHQQIFVPGQPPVFSIAPMGGPPPPPPPPPGTAPPLPAMPYVHGQQHQVAPPAPTISAEPVRNVTERRDFDEDQRRRRDRSRSRERRRDRDRSRDRDSRRDRDGRSRRDRSRDRSPRRDRRRRDSGDRRSRTPDSEEERRNIPPNSTIMVRGLSSHINENDLRTDIADCGLIPKDVRLIRKKDTGRVQKEATTAQN